MDLNNIPELKLDFGRTQVAQLSILMTLSAQITVLQENVIDLSNVLGKPIDEQENEKRTRILFDELHAQTLAKWGK
jgi:hypothetical protein